MDVDVVKEGTEIRYSEPFAKDGINVNFVEEKEADEIIVRTYERGVEDETFSCGTGVTACAIVCHHNDVGYNDVTVTTKGGKLVVKYDRSYDNGYTNIWLCGPAEKAFEGKVEVEIKNSRTLKYASYTGIAAALLLILCCFIPWAYYPDLQQNFTGFYSETKSIWKTWKSIYFSFRNFHCLFSDSKIMGQAGESGCKCIDFCLCIENLFLFAACYLGICPSDKNRTYTACLYFH